VGRKNRRRDDDARDTAPVYSSQTVETHNGEDWYVRRLTGSSSTKPYRCPGCDQEIRPATPHVVAWPVDGEAENRRHWHTPCWAARDRRTSRQVRGQGPRY
jgi:hypothetical protein